MSNSIQQSSQNSTPSILSPENFDGTTFWGTQTQISVEFGTTQQNVALHLKNAYKQGEIEYETTYKESLLVQIEGGRQVTRTVSLYNLDAIIAVGYRVNSIQGTKFRIHATQIINAYILNKPIPVPTKELSALDILHQMVDTFDKQQVEIKALAAHAEKTDAHLQSLDNDVTSLMQLYPDTYTVKGYFNYIGRREPDIATLRAIGKLAKANSGRAGMLVRKAQEGAYEVWMYHESILREVIAGWDRDNQTTSTTNQLKF